MAHTTKGRLDKGIQMPDPGVTGKDSSGQGKIGAGHYLIWVNPRYGCMGEQGTGTVKGASGILMPWIINHTV